MLVLTRERGQSIYIYPEDIDENMRVKDLFAKGPIMIAVTRVERTAHATRVALAIDCPKSLRIMRRELLEPSNTALDT